MHYLVLVSQPGTLRQSHMRNAGLSFDSAQWLAPNTAAVLPLDAAPNAQITDALSSNGIDWLSTPHAPRAAKLFLADMDSTMITVECIDELADYAGIKDQVAAITEAAMRGELDFEAALRERVALLEGMNTTVLEDCYRDKVAFTAGGRTAVQTMAQRGTYCALVSGGFTFFTQRVAHHLGFHEDKANRLEERDGKLTGRVLAPISNASTKLDCLVHHRSRLALEDEATLAVGDGANDIPMLQAAGLGVAYRAKPKTKAAVDCAIDHTDLTTLLYFQGIAQSEHVT